MSVTQLASVPVEVLKDDMWTRESDPAFTARLCGLFRTLLIFIRMVYGMCD